MTDSNNARARRPNGASTVYRGADGKWHGRVTVGVRDDGRPDRRHVERATEAAVIKAVRKLERDRDSGSVRKAGPAWTVKAWLEHWVENIAAPGVRPSTLSAYRVAVRTHLVPAVGGHRLDKLEPEHLERCYARMIQDGSRPATAHQAHRTMRTALNEAMRRGHITRNVASLARAPRIEQDEVEPYSIEEVRQILDVAAQGRNGARWAVALALGLRQGEALGLQWNDIDLDQGVLWVRRGRQRPSYVHGCDGTCGRKHPGFCPAKRNVHEVTSATKSRAGRRGMGLPDALIGLLRKHQLEQAAERDIAAELWRDEGWVFATATGGPVNMNMDHREWKALLRTAGAREARLHDARHTAATVLLLLGVPERAVMGVMGWSSSGMAARYQHITQAVRKDIAAQVDGLIWPIAGKPK